MKTTATANPTAESAWTVGTADSTANIIAEFPGTRGPQGAGHETRHSAERALPTTPGGGAKREHLWVRTSVRDERG